MPLNLASPGIVVKEIDLTTGRVTPSSDKVGAIVAPFAKGPVNYPTLIESENDLLNTFGEPYSTDKHFEHWLVASSYLAYGGSLRVVRAGDEGLKNAYVGTGASVYIESAEDYSNKGYSENTLAGKVFVAKNPGSWANGINVAYIDSKSDQILTGPVDSDQFVGLGANVFQTITDEAIAGVGTTTTLTGTLRGVVTKSDSSGIEVKVQAIIKGSEETLVDYTPYGTYRFRTDGIVGFGTNKDQLGFSTAVTSQKDWFDEQTLDINATTQIKWNSITRRPGTSTHAAARSSRFDELHIVVIDSNGDITGNAGTILEKHEALSKATDAKFSAGSSQYWRKHLEDNSEYIFGLSGPVGVVTTGADAGIGTDASTVIYTKEADGAWDQPAEGVIFAGKGSETGTLKWGKNYGGASGLSTTGSLGGSLPSLSAGYDLFQNTEDINVDFLIMGSSAYSKEATQALANKLIAIAEIRKDAVAFISPHRGAAITDGDSGSAAVKKSAEKITENILEFYSAITASSYAVFDTGHKYMYDRFSNQFRYVPLNGDIAGICARNDINNFPWFSPAGNLRGTILNAIKLAYNPSKSQRDQLYTNRINPVIFSPGSGMILFGDRTGMAKASAFDRINVRRLFIYLEEAISRAAKDALFEFNDELTRTNFVNTVEPFLRDVQAKRGIQDYVVVCDETNNTAAIIDNNEFVADIYIKPARSINFIGLNFIATKTGVDFEEIIGNFN